MPHMPGVGQRPPEGQEGISALFDAPWARAGEVESSCWRGFWAQDGHTREAAPAARGGGARRKSRVPAGGVSRRRTGTRESPRRRSGGPVSRTWFRNRHKGIRRSAWRKESLLQYYIAGRNSLILR